MNNQLRQTRFLLEETDAVRLPESLAEVAVVGRSNVGKSSTLCALCENKGLARVSKTPGRTRGINVFEAAKGKWLVDLPGYGYADAPKREREYWPKMIGNYLGGRPNMKMIFVLVDAELGIGPADMSMLHWLKDQKTPCRVVGTKVDRMGGSRQWEYRKKMAASIGLNPEEIHWTSSKKGYGVKELRNEVIEALGL